MRPFVVYLCGTYYLVKLTVLHSVLRFVCLYRKVLAPPTREISTLMAYTGRSTLSACDHKWANGQWPGVLHQPVSHCLGDLHTSMVGGTGTIPG